MTSRPLVLLALLFLASCATVLNSGPDQLLVDSVPRGATITIDGLDAGTTPNEIPLGRQLKGRLRIELHGYHPVTYELIPQSNALTLLNVIWGIVPGGIFVLVDYLGDKTWSWPTTPIHCRLTPLSKPYTAQALPWPKPRPLADGSTVDDPYDI